ncbi:MAG TPA: methylmalonyl-CoA mutase family protein, partial [Cytophagaceae bacterium]
MEKDSDHTKKFSSVTSQEWEDKIRSELKSKIVLYQYLNTPLKPFYNSLDIEALVDGKDYHRYLTAKSQGTIVDYLNFCDYKTTNSEINESMEGGAGAVHLSMPVGGIDLAQLESLCPLFINVEAPSIVVFNIDHYPSPVTLIFTAELFLNHVSFQSEILELLKKASIQVSIKSSGNLEDERELANLLDAYQLLFVKTKEEGLSTNEYIEKIGFSIPLRKNFFQTIARIRSLKALAKGLLGLHNHLEELDVKVHCFNSQDSSTNDPYGQFISMSYQAMSSIIGGASSITLVPKEYDGYDYAFFKSISRNILNVLQFESGLQNFIDSSGGSYYIESLTEIICQRTWECFCEN